MRLIVLVLLALCAVPLTLPAKDRHTDFQYAQLYRLLLQNQQDDPDGAFETSLVLASAKGRRLPADTKAELLDGDRLQSLALGAQLTLDLPIDAGLAERQAIVRIDQDDVVFSQQSRIRIPTGIDLTYWDLAKAAQAQERQIDKSFGGLFGAAGAPTKTKVAVINLKFARSAGQLLELTLPDGSQQVFHERGGMIELPWNPEWRDAKAHLSEPIDGIVLEIGQSPLQDLGDRPR